MKVDESFVQQQVQAGAMHFGCTLLRNNNGACTDNTGRLVRYGLGHTSPKQEFKSSDLIGITKTLVTQEMVGTYVGIFTALEIKKPEWNCNKKLDDREVKQNNFLQWVISMGGIGAFCNKVDNLKDIFRN
jgi:hypothetical protein